MNRVIRQLNNDLGQVLTHSLEGIARQEFDGGVETYARPRQDGALCERRWLNVSDRLHSFGQSVDADCGYLHGGTPSDLAERLRVGRLVCQKVVRFGVAVMAYYAVVTPLLIVTGRVLGGELRSITYLMPGVLGFLGYLHMATRVPQDRSYSKSQRRHNCAIRPVAVKCGVLMGVLGLSLTFCGLAAYPAVEGAWANEQLYGLLAMQIPLTVGGIWATVWLFRVYARANGEAAQSFPQCNQILVHI